MEEDEEIKRLRFVVEKLESLKPVIDEMDSEEYTRLKRYIYDRMSINLA